MVLGAREIEEDFPGTERFVVQRRLGAGGMGVVYECLDRERRQLVALKTLRRLSSGDAYRLKQEFRALADMSHPNLVHLYELSAWQELLFFTMELVLGTNLLSWVRGDRDVALAETMQSPHSAADAAAHVAIAPPEPATPPPGARIARLRAALRQLAEGVSALHEAGMLHRDIKPSNVLVTEEGRVVLLDFGLVSPVAQDRLAELDSGVVGTPAYMAPEQGAGLAAAPASDWYSVGVMLYEALTGRLPFLGRAIQILMDKQQFEPPPPAEVAPGVPEDLNALCVDLLRRVPDARPSGREVLRRLGSTQAPGDAAVSTRSLVSQSRQLVGREAQLAELRRAFEDARAGRAVVVYVLGSSGMGKTALARRFLDELEADRRAVVLAGRCYEKESVPYKAFDSLIDALMRHLLRLGRPEVEALLPRDVLALARLFPVLRQVPAIADAPRRNAETPDPQELRRRGFGALRELLARIADRHPLVLCIDDLQWGDVDGAALLADLLRPPDPPPFLFLGLFRREEARTCAFARALDAALPLAPREVAVGPLIDDEARGLALRLLAGAVPEPERVAAAIAREAAGSPFLLVELVRHVQAGADLAQLGEPGRATQATLDELMRSRLVRLPAPARRLLEIVAVAGAPVAQAVIWRAADQGGDARAHVALLRAGHLVRTRGVRDQDEIEAYHDRIRETLVGLLAPDELAAHHRRLALALEAGGDADPEAIAVHFAGAGELERAAHHSERAAARAAEMLAFERAAALYRRTLELRARLGLGHDPAGAAQTRRLRAALGDALANAGRGARAAEAYLEATVGATAAERLELRRRAAEQFLRSGHFDRGLEALETVLGAIGTRLAPTPARALASLVVRRAQARLRGLRFHVRDTSQVSAEELTRVDIYWSVSTALGMVDNIRAADFQTRHLVHALRAGEPYRVARALATEACYSSAGAMGAARRTQRLVAEARTMAERSGHPHAIAMATFAAGFTAACEGRFRAARELCAEAERLLRDRCTNVAWEVTVMQQLHLCALCYLGEMAELQRRVPALLEQAEERGDRFASVNLRSWIAIWAWLAAGDVDGARSALADSRWQPTTGGFLLQDYWHLFAREQVDLYAGEIDAAWRRLVELWPQLARSQLLRIQALRLEALGMRARAAILRARDGGDRGLWRRAEADARGMRATPTPWSAGAALLVEAAVARARGDDEGASTRLARAAERLDAVDLRVLAAAARRQRGRLVGGDEGRALVAQADAALAAQQVRDPARLVDVLAPGCA